MMMHAHIATLSYCDKLTVPSAPSRVVALLAALDGPDGELFLLLSTVVEPNVRDPLVRSLLLGSPPGLTRLIDANMQRATKIDAGSLVEALATSLQSSLFVSALDVREVLRPTAVVDDLRSEDLFGPDWEVTDPKRLPLAS